MASLGKAARVRVAGPPKMADDYAREFPADFPQLQDKYKKKSGPSVLYNCIAWAATECHRWWEPHQDAYWPLELTLDYDLDYTLENYVGAFELQGYKACNSPARERGFQKIAIYLGQDEKPTHAARQTWRGFWLSKLGPNIDIRHENLDVLAGGAYGRVAQIMKRPWTVINLLKAIVLSIRVSRFLHRTWSRGANNEF